MNSPGLFGSAGGLGVLLGFVLAAITPTAPPPMKVPEWRDRYVQLRQQSEALYAYSLPDGLPRASGYPHWSAAAAPHPASAEIAWRPPPPLPPDPPADLFPPPLPTGNEPVVERLRALNAALDQPAEAQVPVLEPDLPGEEDG